MKNKISIGFVGVLLLAILFSCSPERRLAHAFLKQKNQKGAVLVVQPFELSMNNNNVYRLDSVKLPEGISIDSLLFQQTKVLKKVSDSIFLEKYVNSFIKNLRSLGYQVYLPNQLDAFRNQKLPAYILKFAQVDLGEEIYSDVIKDKILGDGYSKTFYLNLLSLNTWFEFEAQDTLWNKVLYAEDAIVDELNGEFVLDQKTNKPILYYTIDSLKVDDAYFLAEESAKKYASYFNDFLMNAYIKMHFPATSQPSQFFHYQVDQKMLFPLDEGFEEITKSEQ